jgi:hypothetical protein
MLKCSKISEIVSLEPISPLLLHFQRARYNVKGFSYAVWTPCYHSHFIGNETEGQTGSVIQPRSFSCYALLLSFKPSFLSLKPSSDSWHLDLRVSSIPIPCFHCPWAFTLFRLPEIVYCWACVWWMSSSPTDREVCYLWHLRWAGVDSHTCASWFPQPHFQPPVLGPHSFHSREISLSFFCSSRSKTSSVWAPKVFWFSPKLSQVISSPDLWKLDSPEL